MPLIKYLHRGNIDYVLENDLYAIEGLKDSIDNLLNIKKNKIKKSIEYIELYIYIPKDEPELELLKPEIPKSIKNNNWDSFIIAIELNKKEKTFKKFIDFTKYRQSADENKKYTILQLGFDLLPFVNKNIFKIDEEIDDIKLKLYEEQKKEIKLIVKKYNELLKQSIKKIEEDNKNIVFADMNYLNILDLEEDYILTEDEED